MYDERAIPEDSFGLTVPIALASLLLLGQLLVGTDIYFAFAVYFSILLVILTLRNIGPLSVAGVLIFYFAFRYFFFSQVIKTLYGQPGDSNLAAPDTTISVLFIGTLAMCGAAVLAKYLLGNRRVIAIDPSPEALLNVRNFSFVLGLFFLIAPKLASGGDAGSEPEYGGLNGISNQFDSIAYIAVYAETWRVLALSNGKRSVSAPLAVIAGVLTTIGFFYNSKWGMALPFIIYIVGTLVYRRRITLQQLGMGTVAVVIGIGFFYPAIQSLRDLRNVNTGVVGAGSAGEFVYRSVTDPGNFAKQWEETQSGTNFGTSLYVDGLYYLGSYDELMSRFMLIANTDVIVAAVDQSGPYGWGLVAHGLESTPPTMLYPDKPRIDTGDLLTWYYGLRTWGVVGAVATGILADSYAVGGLPTVAVLIFVLMFAYFCEIQLTGTGLAGNFVGAYFVIRQLHGFGEAGLSSFIVAVLRSNLVELAAIVLMFYVSDMIIQRRDRARRGPMVRIPAAGVEMRPGPGAAE